MEKGEKETNEIVERGKLIKNAMIMRNVLNKVAIAVYSDTTSAPRPPRSSSPETTVRPAGVANHHQRESTQMGEC